MRHNSSCLLLPKSRDLCESGKAGWGALTSNGVLLLTCPFRPLHMGSQQWITLHHVQVKKLSSLTPMARDHVQERGRGVPWQ